MFARTRNFWWKGSIWSGNRTRRAKDHQLKRGEAQTAFSAAGALPTEAGHWLAGGQLRQPLMPRLCSCCVRLGIGELSAGPKPGLASKKCMHLASWNSRIEEPTYLNSTKTWTSGHDTMSAESTWTRPLLMPQNRKLRHLRGIWLRNLTFSRPRGRTIDDAQLNKATKAKLDALRDSQSHSLHHTHSSENLRPVPGRRRSTNLANASPITRQKRIEDTLENKLADAFFSLHVEGEDEPLYVSEVAERATVCAFCMPLISLPQ